MIAGTVYLLHGQPVTAVCAWRQQRKTEQVDLPLVRTKATTPRNVLLELAGGRQIVLPFRGLRRAD